VAVEPFHLDQYVSEQAFRYKNRATKDNKLTDSDRFTLLISKAAGKHRINPPTPTPPREEIQR
jgi:hypothetical protein